MTECEQRPKFLAQRWASSVGGTLSWAGPLAIPHVRTQREALPELSTQSWAQCEQRPELGGKYRI